MEGEKTSAPKVSSERLSSSKSKPRGWGCVCGRDGFSLHFTRPSGVHGTFSSLQIQLHFHPPQRPAKAQASPMAEKNKCSWEPKVKFEAGQVWAHTKALSEWSWHNKVENQQRKPKMQKRRPVESKDSQIVGHHHRERMNMGVVKHFKIYMWILPEFDQYTDFIYDIPGII